MPPAPISSVIVYGPSFLSIMALFGVQRSRRACDEDVGRFDVGMEGRPETATRADLRPEILPALLHRVDHDPKVERRAASGAPPGNRDCHSDQRSPMLWPMTRMPRRTYGPL